MGFSIVCQLRRNRLEMISAGSEAERNGTVWIEIQVLWNVPSCCVCAPISPKARRLFNFISK